jgi:hypothetical protein
MSPCYDPAQRAAAAAIQRDHPNWVIMYGAHSRMFYAFPLFRAPPGAIIAAPSPADLLTAMRAAELAARHYLGPRPPPPGWPLATGRPASPRDQQGTP